MSTLCDKNPEHFYARQQNASRVLAMAWASVRPSDCVCLSVTQCLNCRGVGGGVESPQLFSQPS